MSQFLEAIEFLVGPLARWLIGLLGDRPDSSDLEELVSGLLLAIIALAAPWAWRLLRSLPIVNERLDAAARCRGTWVERIVISPAEKYVTILKIGYSFRRSEYEIRGTTISLKGVPLIPCVHAKFTSRQIFFPEASRDVFCFLYESQLFGPASRRMVGYAEYDFSVLNTVGEASGFYLDFMEVGGASVASPVRTPLTLVKLRLSQWLWLVSRRLIPFGGQDWAVALAHRELATL